MEPEWIDDIQKNGELFYLELSESEEEAVLVQANIQVASANHVHFSEKEAEVITEESKKQQCGPLGKNQPTLKRLTRILRKKHRSSLPERRTRKKNGSIDSQSSAARPPSILKNQPGQKPVTTVQQQQLKDVCVYLNPKRLRGSHAALYSNGGLLEMLLGIVHCPVRGTAPGEAPAIRKEEVLTVHGLIPNSPATKCGQILIGKVIISAACHHNEQSTLMNLHRGLQFRKSV